MNIRSLTSVRRGRNAAVVALALAAMVATTANASPTFTSFAGYKGTPANNPPNGGELGFTINVPAWTSAPGGYNFLYYSPAAATGGVVNQFADVVALYSVASPVPDGGSFLALDSTKNTQDSNDPTGRAVSTTVSGLTIGATESISFWWADAQQAGFNGATSDALTVSLGAQSHTTASVSDASMSSTPWILQTFTFTATNTVETLSFLASGTPNTPGVQAPAFALLDNISISESIPTPPSTVPEPGSLVLMSSGLAGIAGLVRMRFHKNAAKKV